DLSEFPVLGTPLDRSAVASNSITPPMLNRLSSYVSTAGNSGEPSGRPGQQLNYANLREGQQAGKSFSDKNESSDSW
ncbi:hypothetical protein CU097_005476, partial [Rhizopus azygosporus]